MSDDAGPIVGIDLGTTNSVVAVVIDGQPRVLDDAGEKLLPSVVGIDAQGRLVTGAAARNQLAAFPDRTVASIKRKMGRMDPIALGDQTFTPPEISAIVLRRLRDRASRALGRPVTRAVITVPAFFDDNQRQATREAATLAGLVPERIVNEPTAATLVYHAGSQDRKQIAVYDFGGGTFDVSIVRMEAGVVEVLSSKGDVNLGGDDLDRALIDRVAGEFQDLHGLDLRANPQARHRLWLACEQAKIRLSTEATARIAEEFIAERDGRPLHLTATVQRAEFEELIEPFVARTLQCLDEALQDAGLTVDRLDDLVLVGGSTRIPLIEERLREEFRREPSRAVDPDLAVALGAAVQAATIDGISVGPVLVDVTAHTLGIEACEGYSFAGPETIFSPIVRRNSPLPARYEQPYATMFDDQKEVEIHVLQGERPEVHRNRSIGRFRLDVEAGGGDRSQILVRFDLTLDGTLKVTATQPATGRSHELTIENSLSQFRAGERTRAEARLAGMFESSDAWHDEDDGAALVDRPADEAEFPESRGADDRQTREAKFPAAVALLTKASAVKSSVSADDARDIESLTEKLDSAMAADDPAAVASLSAELDDILFYVR